MICGEGLEQFVMNVRLLRMQHYVGIGYLHQDDGVFPDESKNPSTPFIQIGAMHSALTIPRHGGAMVAATACSAPTGAAKVDAAVRARLAAGEGVKRVAKALKIGTGTVARIKAEQPS
jgi:hypothetical protein